LRRRGEVRPASMLSSLLSSIDAPPAELAAEAQRHLDGLTKPPGSLGRLEEIALRLAVLRGGAPGVHRPVIFTFAADHGVVAEGVSAYPQIVTAQMVENFLGGGAAVNVLARAWSSPTSAWRIRPRRRQGWSRARSLPGRPTSRAGPR